MQAHGYCGLLPQMTRVSAAEPSPKPTIGQSGWVFLLLIALAYAGTRLYQIEAYPIYFFCDEAVHSVCFDELVANEYRSISTPNELLPAYFLNGRMMNLSLSVYLQGLVGKIIGNSVVGVRATSALASLFGAFGLALLLRRMGVREWWLGIGFPMVMGGLLLHTRTAFECVLMFAAYSLFLYCYARYLLDSPRWILPAMFFGAATFYSYAPGQGLMAGTGLFLFISDGRHHLRNWRWALLGLVFALLLFVPYVRSRVLHPEQMEFHLKELRSYWMQDIGVKEKLWLFAQNYAGGFSPRYWLAVSNGELVRHVVPLNPYIPPVLAGFALTGLALCLGRWRSPVHRLLVGALLATALSGAVVAPGITRNLAFMAVFTLIAALGFDWLTRMVRSRAGLLTLRYGCMLTLLAAGVALLADVLTFGPSQSRDYGLYGLQWGAQRVHRDTIPRYLDAHPEAMVFISSVWANNQDVYPRFFGWYNRRRVYFCEQSAIRDGGILPGPKDFVLLTQGDVESLRGDPCLERFDVRERIDYPNGMPAFYFGNLILKPEFRREKRLANWFGGTPNVFRIFQPGVSPFSVLVAHPTGGEPEQVYRAEGGRIEVPAGVEIRMEIYFDEAVSLEALQLQFSGDAEDLFLRVMMGQKETWTSTREERLGSRVTGHRFALDSRPADRVYIAIQSLKSRVVLERVSWVATGLGDGKRR